MMESPYSSIKKKLATYVESAGKTLGYDTSSAIDMMSMSKAAGDISCSIAFKISKAKGSCQKDSLRNSREKTERSISAYQRTYTTAS